MRMYPELVSGIQPWRGQLVLALIPGVPIWVCAELRKFEHCSPNRLALPKLVVYWLDPEPQNLAESRGFV